MKIAVHPKGYVPLWKQWQQSKEFKDYLKNELPSVNKKMAEYDGLTAAQREEAMVKQFNLRWIEQNSGKVQESTHKSEKSAKDKARDLSFKSERVEVGEVDDGKLVNQWAFEKGRQQAMNTKQQVTVAPITKKEAASIKSNQELKGTTAMSTSKNTKNGQKAKANGTGKATKVAAKAKSQPSPKSGGQEPKKTGTIRDAFGLREGSNRQKLVDCLLGAKGKAVPVAALLKATYGSSKDELKSSLNMVLKGMTDTIAKGKIKLTLVKEKDDKGMTYALKAK